ncbi:TlpA family protein disulfide reductase [Streptomyces sp. NBC_00481]|uniref:TlpA family protein disulfide reductase n=1 Tax=unclassified Streptomyces TaxID=2593676 RepID=UPI002DD8A929|nr:MULTISPECIES: TlpA disulfide reductase family protein [unclassified Streptomyces]WRY97299.1 TlpA family protein disulfide reductase [Streptomyces sp. NBC_00481]
MATTKTMSRVVVCALSACLALSGCATTEPLVLADPKQSQASLFKSIPVADRTDAPDFAGTTVDGKPVRLSDYRGKVVVVNAWASTCAPCRKESPDLERTQRRLADQGLQVLGVTTDTERKFGLDFQQELGLTYPSLHDPDGKQFLKLPRGMVNPQILPFTLFIDREGRIAGASQSIVTEQEVTSIVTPMLKEKPAENPGEL